MKATPRTTRVSGEVGGQLKAAHRQMWALGNYHEFAKATVWELGAVLVEACGITAGQRVLDVAAGSGNVALRAAQAGAAVTASDLTPENLEAGRRAAHEAGVVLRWVEADAENLPFEDGEFDVVTSCLGAMFAPDHHAVAGELLRVCRIGGTLGMINFTPQGTGGDFFRVLAPYFPPPPPGVQSPVLWGEEAHVRELFGDRVEWLTLTCRQYVERAQSARAYVDFFKKTFGPLVAIGASLAAEPARQARLDRDLLEYVARSRRDPGNGPVEIPYEYLLIKAARRT